MKFNHIKLAMLTTGCLLQPVQAENIMSTSGLFERTIDSVPGCIEYCVDGVSLYMIITPFGITYYWTPNVSHNSPDILMMAHNDIRKTPWTDFNSYFGKSYAGVTEKLAKLIFKDVKTELGGGRSRHEHYGQYQAVNYKEATGVGHPASMILMMFGRGGLRPKGYWVGSGDSRYWHSCRTNGCLEEDNTPVGNSIRQEMDYSDKNEPTQDEKNKDSKKFLDSWPSPNTTPIMLQSFGGNLQNMDKVANNQSLNKGLGKIGNKVSSFGSVGQRIFCPISITPFVPYYLSGADGIQWRGGYPITDTKHSARILNPLSKDRIGKGRELWGHIYPREGTVNHEWDAKVGTVIAVRAASILNEGGNSLRVVNKPSKSNHGFGGWGKIYPKLGDTTAGASASVCHKNPINTGTTLDESGSYAWTYWRRYNCDLRTTGIHITTIHFGPICLTDKVPE